MSQERNPTRFVADPEFLYQVKGLSEKIRQEKLDRLDRKIQEAKKV